MSIKKGVKLKIAISLFLEYLGECIAIILMPLIVFVIGKARNKSSTANVSNES